MIEAGSDVSKVAIVFITPKSDFSLAFDPTARQCQVANVRLPWLIDTHGRWNWIRRKRAERWSTSAPRRFPSSKQDSRFALHFFHVELASLVQLPESLIRNHLER